MKKFVFFALCGMLCVGRSHAQVTIVPYNDTWKYLDNGTNQGTTWRNSSFSDASWKSGVGKFGYGITDAKTAISYGPDRKNKYVTTYFRKTISILNPAAFPYYIAQLKRDDGAVVYVNGTEVYRTNMPTGTISYTTLASLAATDDGTVGQSFNINRSFFVAGSNVIAVEIHQQKTNNGEMDMAFDFNLASPDVTPPTVLTINRQSPLAQFTTTASLTFRVSFSEPVTGVDASDFILTPTGTATGNLASNAVSAVGTDGTTYDVTANSIAGSGTLRLDLKATGTGIADASSNAINGGFTSGQTYSIDHTAPTALSINRQSPSTDPTSSSSLTYRIIFSESVSGVDASDFTLTVTGTANGVLSSNAVAAVGTDGTTYDVTASTVTGSGTMGLNLKTSNTGIIDIAGNAIVGGLTGQTYTIDHTAPTVLSMNRQSPSNAITSSASVTFRLSFSEPVNGVDAADFSLTATGGVTGTLAADAVAPVGTDGTIYDVTVSAVAGEGTVRLDLNASATGISDVLGNAITDGYTSGQSYTMDHVTLTVATINRQSPLQEFTSATSLVFRITFSKTVSGVDATDFTLTTNGTAAGTLDAAAVTAVDVDNTTFDVAVNTVSGNGTIRLDLNSSGTGISDIGGNTLSGGFTAGQSYSIDQTAPTVLSINRQSPIEAATRATSLTYRIVFSEAVTGVDPTDFSFNGTGTATALFDANSVTVVGTDGTTYDITVGSVTGSGTLRLDLKATGTDIVDAAGNASGGYTSGERYTIDQTPPEAVSISRQLPLFTITSSPSVTFRIVFSEAVNGVDPTDFSLATTGSVAGILTAGAVTPVGTQGNSFDVTVSSITGEGTLGLNLKNSGTGITDILGNNILDGFSSGETYTMDHVLLIVASINRQSPAGLTTSQTAVTYRVTFSKPVTGVDRSDFTLSVLYGTVQGTLAADAVVPVSGSEYDVTVSSLVNAGTLRLDLNATGTGIVDASAHAINGGFNSGQYYTIRPQDLPPAVLSINRQSPADANTSAGSVTFRVSFSEPVIGIDSLDFIAKAVSGNVRGTLVTLSEEPVGVIGTEAISMVDAEGTVYDVSVRAIAGNGTLRLDLRSTNSGIIDATSTPINGGYVSGQTYNIQSVSGFTTFSDLTPLSIASHTAEKPQSKTWNYAGKWWTVMSTDLATKLFRLDGSSWTDVLTLGASTNVKADCIVAGNVVHILAFRGTNTSFVYSVEYDASINSYKLWSLRTTRASIQLEANAKTATMTLDGNGRMWIANDGLSAMYLRWSDAPYATWSAPITLATGVMDDDICALVSLPGKIGIMWSNQNAQRFGFETHVNGANPATWSADEAPGASGALPLRYGLADDHINLIAASDGTVYAAVKDGYDTPSQPKVGLLVRRPTGIWDDLYPVTANEGTRPIVLLNEAAGKLKVVYSSHETGGDILYRESSTSTISFSRPYTLIGGNPSFIYNYATSSHQTYSSEILILATDMTTGPSPISLVGILATEGSSAPSASRSTVSSTVSKDAGVKAPEGRFFVYPNPFANSAVLSFSIPDEGNYTISLYNSAGAKIAVLNNGRNVAGKLQTVNIDGSRLASGIYWVQLQTMTGTKTIKLVRRK